MAYRRSARRRTTRTTRARRSYSAPRSRVRSRSRVRRSSSRARPQTVRLVIEQAPASAVARPDIGTKAEDKKRAKF